MPNLYRPEYRYKGEVRQSSVWWYSAYRNGKRVRRSTRTRDKQEAAKVMYGELATVQPPPRASGVTLGKLSELIVQDYELHGRRSLPRLRRSLRALQYYYGRSMKASKIDTAAVVAYAAARIKKGAARATVNRELAALRRAFNLAVEQGLLSTVPKVKTLTENNTRTHFVSKSEMKRLAAELPDELRPLAYVGYLTGWRKGELLSRRWKHLDMEAGWLRLNSGETKAGGGRQFPITPELHRIFTRQEKKAEKLWGEIKPEKPLFFHYDGPKEGQAIRNFDKAWRKARHEAELDHIVFHDLRRSAIRNLVRSEGVSETVAMRLSGHKTREVFDRYDIVSEDDLKRAGESLSAFIRPKNRSKVVRDEPRK